MSVMNWSSICMALTRPSLSLMCKRPIRLLFGRYHKFELLARYRSAAKYWWYGGKYYMDSVGNLLLFQAVKEFWKFVKNNWQNYRHEFGVLRFTTRCWTQENHQVADPAGGTHSAVPDPPAGLTLRCKPKVLFFSLAPNLHWKKFWVGH